MKRMLALLLCLVMVFGLLTGFAGAEETTVNEELFIFDYWDPESGPMGSLQDDPSANYQLLLYYGYNAETGEKTPIPENATVSLYEIDRETSEIKSETPLCQLPFVEDGESGYWSYDMRQLKVTQDYQSHYIMVAEWTDASGTRYSCATDRSNTQVIINTLPAAVYADPACTDYIPYSDRTFVVGDEAITVYIRAWDDMGYPEFNGIFPNVLCQETDDPGIYMITAPANMEGTETITISYPQWDSYWHFSLTFTDGYPLFTRWDDGGPTDSGFVSAYGEMAFRMTYGMDNTPVPGDATVIFRDWEGNETDNLGQIHYNHNDGRWVWNLDSAIPLDGTMEVTIDGSTYSRHVCVEDPDVVFLTMEGEDWNYIPYSESTLTYSGTDLICYIFTPYDWVETVTCSNDNFMIAPMEDDPLMYTVTAKEGTTGTHNATITATDYNVDFSRNITFTDGTNLTLFEGDDSLFDTESIYPDGQTGINLFYGPNNTPVPAETELVITPDDGYSVSDLGDLYYEVGSNDWGEWTYIWNLSSAIPGASGTLSVTIDDTTYSCPVAFSVPDMIFLNSEDEIVPVSDSTFYYNGTDPIFYVSTSEWINDVSCSSDSFIVTPVEDELDLYAITAAEGTTGTHNATIFGHYTDGGTFSRNITFTDGTNLSTIWDNGSPTDDGIISAAGTWGGFRMVYGKDLTDVPPDTKVVLKDSAGNETTALGDVGYNQSNQHWYWNRNCAVPGTTGTMEVTIGSKTYTRTVSVEAAEISFYEDSACQNYIPFSELTLAYSPGTPAAYIQINQGDSPSISHDHFYVAPVEGNPDLYAIYATEAASGTYTVQAGNSWLSWDITLFDAFSMVMTQTDGSIISTIDVGTAGCPGVNLFYGPDRKPLPAYTPIVATADTGYSSYDLGRLFYEPGTDESGTWDWVWDRMRAYPGASGTFSAVIDGQTYSLRVTYTEPDVVLYSDPDCVLEHYIPYTKTQFAYQSGSQPDPVYARVQEEWVVSAIECSNENIIITAPAEGTDYYTISLEEGAAGRQSASICFKLQHQSNSNWANWFWVDVTFTDEFLYGLEDEYILVSEAREVDAAEVVTDYQVPENDLDSAVPFQMDGSTYYMAISFPEASYPFGGHGMGTESNDPNMIHFNTFMITFWRRLDGGTADRYEYAQITDAETLEKFRTFFTSTSLTMEPLDLDDSINSNPVPTHYPAIYRDPYLNEWQRPITAALTWNTEGLWLYTATCQSSDGQSITAHIILNFQPDRISYWSPDPTSDISVIDQVNEYIASLTYTVDETDSRSRVRHHVVLPAGDYYGTIEAIYPVTIDGTHSNNGELLTRLHGGIVSKSEYVIGVESLHLIGEGANRKTRSDGTPNKGFYGDGHGGSWSCIYEDFNVAVDNTHGIKASYDTTYLNNDCAIRIDADGEGAGGANPTMSQNTFIGNKIAIHFQSLAEDFPLTFWDWSKNVFISNKKDVRNQLKRPVYLPGCFFGYMENDEVHIRDIQVQENGKNSDVATEFSLRTAAEEEDLSGLEFFPVYAYPVYQDPECTMLEYDRTDTPVVSTAYTKDYPIPADSLNGKNITVMDGETELAQLDFTASGYNLRRTLSAGITEFDATVSVSRTDSSVAITLSDLPAGKTPVVRIPCGNIVDAVTATHSSGAASDVTVENGYLCFVATTGGTWTIQAASTFSTTEGTDSFTVTISGSGAFSYARTVTVSVPESWLGMYEQVSASGPDYTETCTISEDGTITFAAAKPGAWSIAPSKVILDQGGSLVLKGVVNLKRYTAFDQFPELTGETILANGGMLLWTEADLPQNLAAAIHGTETDVLALKQEGSSNGLIEYSVQYEVDSWEYAESFYFRPFVELNGRYYYGELTSFGVKEYCEGRFEHSESEELKSALVALLNYGATAQTYFDLNAEDLANKDLENYVEWYGLDPDYLEQNWKNDYLTELQVPDAGKTANFAATNTITDNGKSLILRGAISLKFYMGVGEDGSAFTNAKEKAFYIWTAEDYEKNSVLTKDNATKVVVPELTYSEDYGYEYSAKTDGIYAMYYGDTVYGCLCVTDSNGVEHCSGVVAYSPEAYAKTKLTDGTTAAIDPLVQWMVIYGERAKTYFDTL